MHPLLSQEMAQLHREELLREFRAAHLAERFRACRGGKSGHSFSHVLLWYLLLGLRESVRINEQEDALDWLEDRLAAISRVVGIAALGVGLLAGSFMNTGLAMFLAVLLGAAVSLPILARAVMLLK